MISIYIPIGLLKHYHPFHNSSKTIQYSISPIIYDSNIPLSPCIGNKSLLEKILSSLSLTPPIQHAYDHLTSAIRISLRESCPGYWLGHVPDGGRSEEKIFFFPSPLLLAVKSAIEWWRGMKNSSDSAVSHSWYPPSTPLTTQSHHRTPHRSSRAAGACIRA
jgi:hypothetical protein